MTARGGGESIERQEIDSVWMLSCVHGYSKWFVGVECTKFQSLMGSAKARDGPSVRSLRRLWVARNWACPCLYRQRREPGRGAAG